MNKRRVRLNKEVIFPTKKRGGYELNWMAIYGKPRRRCCAETRKQTLKEVYDKFNDETEELYKFEVWLRKEIKKLGAD